MTRSGAAALAGVALQLAGPPRAWARSDSPTATGASGVAARPVLAAALVGLALLLALTRPALRTRIAALGLTGALGIFVFADAVHSVHHLPDHGAASPCAIAAASPHIHGAIAEAPPAPRPPLSRPAGHADRQPAPPPLEPVWAVTGRAPPLPGA